MLNPEKICKQNIHNQQNAVAISLSHISIKIGKNPKNVVLGVCEMVYILCLTTRTNSFKLNFLIGLIFLNSALIYIASFERTFNFVLDPIFIFLLMLSFLMVIFCVFVQQLVANELSLFVHTLITPISSIKRCQIQLSN